MPQGYLDRFRSCPRHGLGYIRYAAVCRCSTKSRRCSGHAFVQPLAGLSYALHRQSYCVTMPGAAVGWVESPATVLVYGPRPFDRFGARASSCSTPENPRGSTLPGLPAFRVGLPERIAGVPPMLAKAGSTTSGVRTCVRSRSTGRAVSRVLVPSPGAVPQRVRQTPDPDSYRALTSSSTEAKVGAIHWITGRTVTVHPVRPG